MKSEIVIDNVETEECTYPWLGHCFIGDKEWERVVLFTRYGAGTVVSAIGSCTTLGEYSNAWDEDMFEEFKGKVILSND